MQLWRLYRAAHGPGLDGIGGLHAAGRWHPQGRRVVYFGASAATVVLEKLAHVDPEVLPNDLVLARFEGAISVQQLANAKEIDNIERTRASGAAFLDERRACALRVPSTILPEESNLVVNPLHSDAGKIKLVKERLFHFDGRLTHA